MQLDLLKKYKNFKIKKILNKLGSPTVPINLREEQSCFVTKSSGNAIKALTAVGAV